MENKRKIVAKQQVKKNPKYKLRKLSVGVVSFMCGYALFFGGTYVAHAEENTVSKIIAVPNDKETKPEEAENTEEVTKKEENKKEVENTEEKINNTIIESKDAERNLPKETRLTYKSSSTLAEKKEAIINAIKKENPQAVEATIEDEATIPENVEENVPIHKEDKTENLENNNVIDKFKLSSMVADRSNEGMPLIEGTSFRNTPQEYTNIVKISSKYYSEAPKVRVNENGKKTEYPMTLVGENYEVSIVSEFNFLDQNYRKNFINAIEIVGHVNKEPIKIDATFTSNTVFIRPRKVTEKEPSLVVENKNPNFVGNYNAVPFTITNLMWSPTRSLVVYVKYEKLKGFENDPNVEENFEDKMVFSAFHNNTQTFYVRTPYGYRTEMYGVSGNTSNNILNIDSNGHINLPDRYSVFTTANDSAVQVLNDNTGTASIPEVIKFMNDNQDKKPTSNEVTYSINQSKEEKSRIIESGVILPEGFPTPDSKVILGKIPDTVLAEAVNVPVQLVYPDGGRISVMVPVRVLDREPSNEADAQKYEPTVTGGALSVNKDAVASEQGKEKVTADLLNKVSVPQGVTLADQDGKVLTGELPTAVGTHQVPVRVTYADGTSDTVDVELTITENEVVPPVVTVTPPSVIAQNDGSVIITPVGENVDIIKVAFKDNVDETYIPIVANKSDQGEWILAVVFKGVEINPNSGVITITAGTAKPDTEVTAIGENKDGIRSTESKATVKAQNNPEPKPPTTGDETPTPQPPTGGEENLETHDKKETVTINAPAAVVVYNPFDLTESERVTIVEDIKKANTQITDWENYHIEVDPSGNVDITTTKPNTTVTMNGFSSFNKPNLPVYPKYLDPGKVDLNKLFENEKININVPENMTPETYVEEMKKNPTESFREEVIRVVKSSLEKQGWPMDRVDITYNSLSNVFELEYYIPEASRVNTNGAEKVMFEDLAVPEYNAPEKPYKVTVITNNKPSGESENPGPETKPNTSINNNDDSSNKTDSKQEVSVNKDNSEIRSKSANKLPYTGDTTDVRMYAGLAGLSLLGIFARFRRRKEEETE